MEQVAAIRLTSSRPVYRRGGLQLSNVPLELRRDAQGKPPLTMEATVALLRDPVVRIDVSEDGDNFQRLTDEARAEMVDAIEQILADRPVEEPKTEIPDGTGPDAKTAPDGSADQAKVGDAKEGIPAADTSATSAPAAGTGADISADGGAATGEADKAAADATAAKENSGGVDAKPAPVAAAAPQPKAPKKAKGGSGTK